LSVTIDQTKAVKGVLEDVPLGQVLVTHGAPFPILGSRLGFGKPQLFDFYPGNIDTPFLPWYITPMESNTFSAFRGTTLVASGPLAAVLEAVRALPPRERTDGTVFFFDHSTGSQTDFDLDGPPVKAGPGRPKLGVVSTEVTLLPRHWDWLNAQPARASGTLRRLVESAMAQEASDPKKRREALGKILWVLAGNEPGFEEASRALYAGNRAELEHRAAAWSGDLPAFVRDWS